jgi:hypothetical protein
MRRFFILLFALLWTWLASGTHSMLSYEHATGYAKVSESLFWGGVVSLPLWLGLLTADKRFGWMCYLRWFCAAILLSEAVYIFIVSWMKFLVFPPMIAAVMLVWPELNQQPISPTLEQQRQLRKSQQWNWFILAVVVPVFIWWGWLHNPLPSDEEMIGHFNQHRAEFEQLVQKYRNFRPARTWPAPPELISFEKSSEEVKRLLLQVQVYGLSHGGGKWMPEPYSEKAARFRWGLSTHTANVKDKPLYRTLEDWKREMPELFVGIPQITETDLPHIDRYTSLVTVLPGPSVAALDRFPLRYGGITKRYCHFPQIPHVKDGYLLEPWQTLDKKPYTKPAERVFDSLDTYPPNWKRGECVLKRIDDHWFLSMCRYA